MGTTSDDEAAWEEVLARFRERAISAQVAIMDLLIATEDAAQVERWLAGGERSDPAVRELRALFEQNAEQCGRIVEALRAQQAALPVEVSAEESVRRCRELFDRLVVHSEEASVAMYSLGNADILAAATREIERFLLDLALLAPDARVLDLGCGIGRMEVCLAPHVAEVHGVDVSEAMMEAAQRRTRGLRNVRISLCSGLDLHGIADASYELVLAVDSFPYLVDAGQSLLDRMFAEIRRVLVPNGRLLVLNFSYRDLQTDRADVRMLARRHGFEVRLLGEKPFRLWSGTAFLLQRDG